MRALAAEVELPGLGASEPDADVEQALDLIGALAHAHLDHVAIAQAIARGQGVLDVEVDAVVGGEHRGHAALSPVGVGVGPLLLRDHDDAAMLRGEQGEVEASDAGTDDQVVGFDGLGHGAGDHTGFSLRISG